MRHSGLRHNSTPCPNHRRPHVRQRCTTQTVIYPHPLQQQQQQKRPVGMVAYTTYRSFTKKRLWYWRCWSQYCQDIGNGKEGVHGRLFQMLMHAMGLPGLASLIYLFIFPPRESFRISASLWKPLHCRPMIWTSDHLFSPPVFPKQATCTCKKKLAIYSKPPHTDATVPHRNMYRGSLRNTEWFLKKFKTDESAMLSIYLQQNPREVEGWGHSWRVNDPRDVI